jgi:hypothetical protein
MTRVWNIIAFIHARKEEWRARIISVAMMYDMIRGRGRRRGIRMYDIIFKKVA